MGWAGEVVFCCCFVSICNSVFGDPSLLFLFSPALSRLEVDVWLFSFLWVHVLSACVSLKKCLRACVYSIVLEVEYDDLSFSVVREC